MQYHAIPCNTMQYHAIQCNTMQYHAIPCNIMQYHAIPCNTMQYHASLIIADGAYHCPVGSKRPFFFCLLLWVKQTSLSDFLIRLILSDKHLLSFFPVFQRSTKYEQALSQSLLFLWVKNVREILTSSVCDQINPFSPAIKPG